jgi:hypothetical protein
MQKMTRIVTGMIRDALGLLCICIIYDIVATIHCFYFIRLYLIPTSAYDWYQAVSSIPVLDVISLNSLHCIFHLLLHILVICSGSACIIDLWHTPTFPEALGALWYSLKFRN